MSQGAVQPRQRAERGAEPSPRRAIRRVATYTRVSSDEQAALEFNSLQAQEQICKTYISMRSDDPAAKERWVAAETYSDPGYSGGTLERPSLKRLLADVEAGRIDTLIIYKIDRLSRSIHQFYRIWEVLERRGVDLVSATQDLNTSTSQGKLMLNMLLSFGQFEREQIGERTRDKIQAARRRGRWTGGFVPLGYDLKDGRLVLNEREAAQVRLIFSVYTETWSLTRTVEALARRGVTMKAGAHQNGTARLGRPFDKPTLLRLLRRPVYAGLIRCGASLVPGEHEAVVPREAWQRIQDRLGRNGSAGYQGERQNQDALLQGLLRCGACGSRMTPTYAVKGNKRYAYYACQTRMKRGARACPTGHVAAAEVERRVVEQVQAIGRDPALVAETVRQAKSQLEERVGTLEAEKRRLGKELQRARAGLTRLAGSRGRNGDEAGLADRLAELEARIRTGLCRLGEVDRELAAVKRQNANEADIRSALEAFGPIWGALFPVERARMIRLLVEEVRFDGRDEAVGIAFRPNGFSGLTDSVSRWAHLQAGTSSRLPAGCGGAG